MQIALLVSQGDENETDFTVQQTVTATPKKGQESQTTLILKLCGKCVINGGA